MLARDGAFRTTPNAALWLFDCCVTNVRDSRVREVGAVEKAETELLVGAAKRATNARNPKRSIILPFYLYLCGIRRKFLSESAKKKDMIELPSQV